MRADIALLTFAYVLSQFYRSFLAVLSEILETDIGAGPDDLALASGLWFLSFAAMQIPVGWALDQVGPRRTSAVLLLVGGGGGAALFALASVPMHINLAMLLIGIGCSPVLMASYYIFARTYPPAIFATLAAVIIGVGSLGNLAGSAPLAWLVDVAGWRTTLAGLAAVSALTAIVLYFVVRDPPRVETDLKGSVLDLLKLPQMWLILPIMFVCYAPAAGLRGLWMGPYFADVLGAGQAQIGLATLIMAVAMILGTFAYGPMDRWFGTRKWVVAGGNVGSIIALSLLVVFVSGPPWLAIVLLAAIGFFGGSFPVAMAHGRAFFPPHLIGRGVTLLNLFGIGGVGVMQVITGRLHVGMTASGAAPTDAYAAVIALFAAIVVVGLVPYLFSRDRTD